MLDIRLNENEKETIIELKGSLDVNSAPQLKDKLGELSKNANDVVFDCSALRYVSSAGLRVILGFVNQMEESGGNLKFTHVNSLIMEVFEDTGFVDFLTIEGE